MAQCGGTLVVHLDSTVAACTEEFEGRCCAGSHADHAGGAASCQAVLGPGACETCAAQEWTAPQWRHAVHVGAMVRARRRCTVHAGARRAPVRASEFDELLAALVGDGHAVRRRSMS